MLGCFFGYDDDNDDIARGARAGSCNEPGAGSGGAIVPSTTHLHCCAHCLRVPTSGVGVLSRGQALLQRAVQAGKQRQTPNTFRLKGLVQSVSTVRDPINTCNQQSVSTRTYTRYTQLRTVLFVTLGKSETYKETIKGKFHHITVQYPYGTVQYSYSNGHGHGCLGLISFGGTCTSILLWIP